MEEQLVENGLEEDSGGMAGAAAGVDKGAVYMVEYLEDDAGLAGGNAAM